MNKLIVVTGGSKGIGRAVIEKFAADSFDIFTCSRNEKELQILERELQTRYPQSNVFTFRADMSDKAQVRRFCDAVLALDRPVDVLVNNAGYFIPGEITTEPDGTLESMIHANLYSAYYATRGLAENLKSSKGHIFNICSVASIKAYPNGGSYAISKFALLGFSKCLREELKPHGVRVTSILPGATLTASWEGTNLPEDRFMKIEDVADAIHACHSLSSRSVVEEILIRPLLGDL